MVLTEYARLRLERLVVFLIPSDDDECLVARQPEYLFLDLALGNSLVPCPE